MQQGRGMNEFDDSGQFVMRLAGIAVRVGTISTNAGRMRLPPAPMMYSATWLTSGTSECRRARMTLLTTCKSAAMNSVTELLEAVCRAADKAKPV
jgi:hypothetical protein